MSAARAEPGRWPRRVSAALCLAMVIAFVWLASRQTHGFEVWTFEGQRERQLQAGLLQAAPVPLRTADGEQPAPWSNDGAAPAGAYLVDFIYTQCPSICRALGSEYQQMQAELASRGDRSVRLVSVSFDVANETAGTLRGYARTYHADAARWTIAVPANARDTEALLQSLGVVVIPDGFGGYVHNGAIHLLDARGRLRGLYALDEWTQALEAAQRLAADQQVAQR